MHEMKSASQTSKKTAEVVLAFLLTCFVAILLSALPCKAFAKELTSATPSPIYAQAGSDVTQASALNPNSTVSGVLSEYADEDWYKVVLPQAGKFQIRFQGSYSSDGNWEVSLRDRDNVEMWSDDCYAKDCLAGKTVTMHVTGLPADTFYIRVKGWYVNSLAYSLTPILEPSGTWEREWNDNVEQSNALALGSAVSGTSKSYADEDWYKVVLPKAHAFSISFKGSYNTDGSWEVSVRDHNNVEINSVSYGATTKASKTVFAKTLDAGTYYIRVKGWYVNSLPYKLTPTYYVSQPSISKMKRMKGALLVKWSKISGAKNYVIRYSSKSNMKKAQSLTVSKKTSSKKISSLSQKKKYFVQIRAVEKIGGKTYYSAWSAKKSAKTK